MARLHTLWPGKNRFYCGCCITGPIQDCAANSCWYVCAIAVLIPFSIFICGKLWTDVSPALPIAFYLSVAITTLFFNLTSCTDPGIIPRRPFLENTDSEKYKQLLVEDPEEAANSGRRLCTTCRIYRPARASHCSSCDNCVEVFDHHCPFVNNCVGKRNYRFFVMFLVGVVCSIATAALNFVVFAVNQSGSSIDPTIIIVVCSVIFGVIAIPMVGFLIFHIYLSFTGNTTREVLKHLKSEEKPDNQWCNVDASMINFWQEINPEQEGKISTDLTDLMFPKAGTQ